jgi:hypothetical protein
MRTRILLGTPAGHHGQGDEMLSKRILNKLVHSARVAVAIVTLSFSLGGTLAYATPPDKNHDKDKEKNRESASPIEHVIVIVGENRTFDHIFATYEPNAASPSTTSCPSTSSGKMAPLAPTIPWLNTLHPEAAALQRRCRRTSTESTFTKTPDSPPRIRRFLISRCSRRPVLRKPDSTHSTALPTRALSTVDC